MLNYARNLLIICVVILYINLHLSATLDNSNKSSQNLIAKIAINSGNKSFTLRTSEVSSTTQSVLLATSTEPILSEWGGNCTRRHWDKCSNLTQWVISYAVNIKKPKLGFKTQVIDCTKEAPICLKNGWTVTKCQLLCMKCNREILSKYDKYVAKTGTC